MGKGPGASSTSCCSCCCCAWAICCSILCRLLFPTCSAIQACTTGCSASCVMLAWLLSSCLWHSSCPRMLCVLRALVQPDQAASSPPGVVVQQAKESLSTRQTPAMGDVSMSAPPEKARRRRRPASSPLTDVDGQHPDSWKSAVKEVLGDIRASSPTLQTFREHGSRLRESYDALRRAVQRARRQRTPQNSRGSGQQTLSTDLNRLLKDVGSRKESNLYAAGTLVFGAGLFIAGAAPWLLPACFLLFSAICFPWRMYTFSKRKWGFFLLDFCYVRASSSFGLAIESDVVG